MSNSAFYKNKISEKVCFIFKISIDIKILNETYFFYSFFYKNE